MNKIFEFIGKYLDWIFLGIIGIYILFAFLAPISKYYGYDRFGDGIYKVYEEFCHQRVERSLFLFGKESFYTVVELKEEGLLPSKPIDKYSNIWPEYYGHEYLGDPEVGYKVAFCIRDIALYGAIFVFGSIIVLWQRRKGKKLKVSNVLLLSLALPMVIDGIIGGVVETFRLEVVPFWYINSIEKRIVTGALFGAAVVLLLLPLIYEEEDK